MAKIKVKRGGCGIEYTDANGLKRHALKTPEHGAFECDDAQAAHLVGLGVAEYVGAVITSTPAEPMSGEAAETSGKLTGHLDAADLELMDYNDLKRLAADIGVKPEGQKKADYIAAIAAAEVEVDQEAIVDEDDMPDLSAADPE